MGGCQVLADAYLGIPAVWGFGGVWGLGFRGVGGCGFRGRLWSLGFGVADSAFVVWGDVGH